MSEGELKKRLRELENSPNVYHATAGMARTLAIPYEKVLDEARKDCPIIIGHVYRGSDGKPSGFEKELKISGTTVLVTAEQVIDEFGRWVFKWFGNTEK